jgi:hypothetical protein
MTIGVLMSSKLLAYQPAGAAGAMSDTLVSSRSIQFASQV